jgi:hypothetical protein
MKNISLIFIYLFSIAAFAQTNDFEFTTGIPEKSVFLGINGYQLTEYLYDGTKNIISVKTTATKVTIQRHDVESLKEISRHVYEDLPENSKIIKILNVKNKLVIFYTTLTKSGISILYSREIDNNEGALLAPVKCVEGSGRIWYFQFFQSPDMSKILIQYAKMPVSRNNDVNVEVLGFYVLTSDLTNFSGTEVKMPLTESLLKNMTYAVCNSGSVYFLSKNIKEKKIELRTITDNTTTNIPIHDLDSTFSKISFDKIVMSENAKGNLIFTGYYMNGIDIKFQLISVSLTGSAQSASSEENDNGIFHFEISKTGKLIKKTIYEFPIEFINKNEDKSTKNRNTQNEKKDYAGIPNLQIVNVIENTDESILVIGSQKTYVGMEIGYAYGNIIVSKIDASGKLLWINKIPRFTNVFIGFTYYRSANNDYIFFADDVSNATITDNIAPKYFDSKFSGNLIDYKIDNSTGALSRNTVVDIKNINGISGSYFFRNSFIETVPKTLVIEILTDKGKEVFVKMKIK